MHNAKPLEGANSISELSRRLGIPRQTLSLRISKGQRGTKLRRPPENRGKEITWGGLTFVGWVTELKTHGKHVSLDAVKSYYYRHSQQGVSPEETLTKFKKLHGIKNTTCG